MMHPERMVISNQNPSCASCNINKHSSSLEDFRSLIKGFMNHLNNSSTQYKVAKRYNLIKEEDIPVVFYFETFQQPIVIKDEELGIVIHSLTSL